MPNTATPPVEVGEIVLHGRHIRYRTAGTDGPAVLLIHGIAGGSQTWDGVLPVLGQRCRVIAPDLLGHGDSAKPASGDYSLGGYASDLRDVAVALGYDRLTVVGHSLGGGVAMQFAYQFPERCERLALVASGGLGPEVHVMLRLATLPGSEYVLPLLCSDRVQSAGDAIRRALGRMWLGPMTDLHQTWESFRGLRAPEARAAFLKTARGVIDLGGQRVTATDRLYLAAHVPTLLLWGRQDTIIPAAHAEAAHARIPGSRLEILDGVGHFPQCDAPEVVARLLLGFIDETDPYHASPDRLQELLLQQEGASA